jgi:hypothetical protein
MERYNLTVCEEGKDGKKYWNKIGVMFKREKGGYSIKMHMFPGLNIMAFPPKEDNAPAPQGSGDGQTGADSDFPF